MNDSAPRFYDFEGFRLDAQKKLLLRENQSVQIQVKDFDLLNFLVQNRGRLLEKEELLTAVWGTDTEKEESNLPHHISSIRKILGEKPGEHRFILTLPGRGYEFVASVEEVTIVPNPPASVMEVTAAPDSPFRFYHPYRPIYTHARFLPGSLLTDVTVRDAIISEGCYLGGCQIEESVVGIRSVIQQGSKIRRSILLGADFYDADRAAAPRGDAPRLGIGKNVVLDRVIVDKNARIGDDVRLVNEAGVNHADGAGYYIRDGIIVVPKDGIVKPGTVV